LTIGPQTRCGACGEEHPTGGRRTFFGVLVCDSCHDRLDLDGLENRDAPGFLTGIMAPDGRDAAIGLGALASRMPKDEGWKLLANIHGMTGPMNDPSAKELLRGSLILVAATIIGSGADGNDVPMDLRALTLSLVLGEVLCLSIMKRISNDNGLRSAGRLDDVLITALFRSELLSVLLLLRPAAQSGHESELASAVWTTFG